MTFPIDCIATSQINRALGRDVEAHPAVPGTIAVWTVPSSLGFML